ncbi:MAG: hypothetical protein RIC04_14165 [Parvibaculum sp.]|uniref:hypothetical protein n=1 Tax=Parvibaculum sp. TaxID=2024848 RepID=UPI0032EBF250
MKRMDIDDIEYMRAKPWNSRDFSIPGWFATYPTMLSLEEMRMLAFISGKSSLPEGQVVDLGPFLGGSTVALAWGLELGERRGATVHSFDLFTASERQKYDFLYKKGHPFYAGTDIYELFLNLTRDFRVNSRKVNIMNSAWGGTETQFRFCLSTYQSLGR